MIGMTMMFLVVFVWSAVQKAATLASPEHRGVELFSLPAELPLGAALALSTMILTGWRYEIMHGASVGFLLIYAATWGQAMGLVRFRYKSDPAVRDLVNEAAEEATRRKPS